MGPCHHRLGQQTGQQGGVELHEVRKVHLEGVVKRLLNDRVPASEGEDAETGQEVQVALAVPVVEVAALTFDIEAVETERLQYLYELGIEILAVQAEILALAGFDQRAKLEGHLGSPQATAFPQSVVRGPS